MAGLKVIRTLNGPAIENQARSMVVVWTNEEGSRSRRAWMGSGVFAGKFDLQDTIDRRRDHGLSGRRIAALGYAVPCGAGTPGGGVF